VDLLAGKVEVYCRRSNILLRNIGVVVSTVFLNFAPILRSVELVG